MLLRGIEISVLERMPVAVAPLVGQARIFAAPPFQSPLLFSNRRPVAAIFRNDRRFKVVGESEYQVNWTLANTAVHPVPGVARDDSRCILHLGCKVGRGPARVRLGAGRRLINGLVRALAHAFGISCVAPAPTGSCLSAASLVRGGFRPRTPKVHSPTVSESSPQLSNQRNTCS